MEQPTDQTLNDPAVQQGGAREPSDDAFEGVGPEPQVPADETTQPEEATSQRAEETEGPAEQIEEPEPEPASEEPEVAEAEPEPAVAEAEPEPAVPEVAEAEPEVSEPEPEPAEPEVVEPEAVEHEAEAVEREPEVVEAAVEPVEGEAAEVAEGEPVEEDEEALPEEDTRGEWYFVHTQSGYENKVRANLSTRIVSMNMEERIFEVVIPTEEVMEVKSGKKQLVQKKLFPGYLLVRMDLDDDSWYVVRNTPGVTGFVGSTARPVPLTEKEVEKILQRKQQVERPRQRLEFQTSDIVRVTTGPFANFQGVINEIDVDRSKVKVLVNIFGRETPVELGFDQIQKV